MLLTLNLTAPPTLESVIFLNQTDLSKSIGRNHQFQNLSIEERKAISGPKNNQDIVIKPADKGSSVVVLNTDYIKEATSQLSNNTFYNKLDSEPTLKHNMEVKKILDEMLARNEIDITCYNYLYNEKPRTPRFYLLPKIHKGMIPPPGDQLSPQTIALHVQKENQHSLTYNRQYLNNNPMLKTLHIYCKNLGTSKTYLRAHY